MYNCGKSFILLTIICISRTTKMMEIVFVKKPLKILISSILLISSVSMLSCVRKSTTEADVSKNLSVAENTEHEALPDSSVENQYIIKRKGLAYLQGDSSFEGKFNLKILRKVPSVLLDVVEIKSSSDLNSLQKSGLVEYAEPNYIRKMKVKATQDPSSVNTSSIQSTGISKTPSIYAGSPYMSVAVISTGVDRAHPDLKNKLLKGYSTFSSSDTEDDINGIGTHQAGLITGGTDTNGVFSIAPNSKVMPIKSYNDEGEVKDADLITGIIWAIDHGAQVVTFTADGAKNSKIFDDVFKYAFNKKVPIIVGSGDFSTNQDSFPASSGGAISVSAISSGTQVASFSNTGKSVSVAAPGENIKSLSSTTKLKQTVKYATLSGTAIAATYAAGEMLLIKSKYPDLDMLTLKKHLELTSEPIGKQQFSESIGYGVINPVKAVSVKQQKK